MLDLMASEVRSTLPTAHSFIEDLSCLQSGQGPDSLSLPLSLFFRSRFYDEIRTPLLSDIRIDYPPSLVEQATRTLFPNYFNGSEIIIAGKLVDRKMDRLHVEVTASNSKKFVVLKTDVPVEPQKAGNDVTGNARPKGEREEDSNPLRRLWSYLTVKELLSSWLQSGNEQEKEQLRQKAQALAVNSHFLTPFTSIKLKKPLQLKKLEDPYGMSAATGPETVMQSLQGSNLQPGNETPVTAKCEGPNMSCLPPFQAKVISAVACFSLLCCNVYKQQLYTQLLVFTECIQLLGLFY